jgi:hypothetical protein
VQQIISDFSRGIMYQEVHIICTSFLSDSLLTKLKQSQVKQYIRSCKELGIDFIADLNMYSIEMPVISNIYNPEMDSLLNYELKTMAKKIASVLYNLEEKPYIRYSSKVVAFQSSSPKTLSGELAFLIEKEMETLSPANPKNGTLLILDRKMDCISPLIHDLHYHSMLSDILGMHGGKVKDSASKEYRMEETDAIWKEFSHLHIADCMEKVNERFNAFMNENKAAQWQKEGGARS